jgi:1-acyl-sn-glycerol-3-phosphate acyltransferase
LQGWRYVDHIPKDLKSFVLIGGPHTSNWDFIPAMSVIFRMNRNAKFMIKHSVMVFPLNIILKYLGAIAINRDAIKEGKVKSSTDNYAELFKQHSELVLMVAPEGTRSANDNWKTGFYYIAKKANVPIVLGFCDYKKKIAGITTVIHPTDFEQDMKTIMSYFSDKIGKNPENFKLDTRYSLT